MIFDVIDTVLQVAESFGQVYLEQVSQQILQVGAKVGGESYLQDKKTKIRNQRRNVFSAY